MRGVLPLSLALVLAWGVTPALARPVAVDLTATEGASLGRLVGETTADGQVMYFALADVARLADGTLRSGPGPDRATLRVGSKSLEVQRDQARVRVDRRSVTLAAPVRLRQGMWLVPGDLLVLALPRLLGTGIRVAATAAPPAARASRRPATVVNAPPRVPAAAPAVLGEPTRPDSPGSVPGASVPPPGDGPGTGGGKAGAVELRYRSYPTYTRVVLEGAAPLEPRVVESGGGLVVTLTGLRPPVARTVRAVRDGLVGVLDLTEVRGTSALRVTFDRPPAARRIHRLHDPSRLVLDFYRSTAAATPPGTGGPPGVRAIVIDPGHGGHDPGAVGPRGLQEKELTLDVARRVVALLQDELAVKAVLTRSRDQFVPLRERTMRANRERADLFVSIHVNAAPAATASGAETYFLSSEATDNAARAAAAFENKVIDLEPGARGRARDLLRTILWDLAQSDFQQESSRLAEALQNTLDRALRLPSRGVKQAPFYVLGGAAMPAVLVEVGFITNPQEEQRLSDEGYRDRIARSLAAGLAAYKRSYDQRVARR